MNSYIFYALFVCIVLQACASANEKVDSTTAEMHSAPNITKQEVHVVETLEYAVPESRYTTHEGIRLNALYNTQLNELGREIKLIETLEPLPKTFGFYYDSKTKQSNSLYLGFDCTVATSSIRGNSYPERAWHVIFANCNTILTQSKIIHQILADRSIQGLVIGFYWNVGSNEGVIIWLEKKDIENYLQRVIIYPELLARSTTTRDDGKIINLLLFPKAP